jgi:hypothetical protein
MTGLGGDQVIDQVHGGGETGLDRGVAGGVDQGLGQEGFSGAGIADEQDIAMFGDEVQRKEVEDLGFLVQMRRRGWEAGVGPRELIHTKRNVVEHPPQKGAILSFFWAKRGFSVYSSPN